MDPFLSSILLIAFNYVPQGYIACDGSLLNINQYQPVFALLGTTYGGNGTANFAVPKLAAPAPGLPYVMA